MVGRDRRPLPGPRRRDAVSEPSLVELLDDEVEEYSVGHWRARNIRLVERLAELGLFDPETIPFPAHRFLTESLIHVLNGAATDSQNAGHVRAQNENVIHYGVAAGLSARALSIALEAGALHDLNKAIGEPLRQDEYAVLDAGGQRLTMMTTMAQIVGLNHLGDRTRCALDSATRLPDGPLDPAVARAIDLCIVHHGVGSSRFIRDLIDGLNPWWGSEFVDPETKKRKLFHPEQPPWTIESVIHDLADSTQQMQGGAAWLMKYPAGFWRASGRSLASMLSGADPGPIPLSLRRQIEVETATCHDILGEGRRAGLVDAELEARLVRALEEASAFSSRWIDDSPEYLARSDGQSVYHDVGRRLGIAPEEAHQKLSAALGGSREATALEPILWESGRKVDARRARALAERIEIASSSRGHAVAGG